ncbi:hypothetical protein H2200_000145 [Cladophialophora chaetospira]|uniref:F-box domain-containing protein n=1 Tax=Cladophialophora chaetospira TaxID=386627 RepID=A0AA38XN12_9EURO|nr:hypothetical protein H2200_000145 [Cladophialophora chaetospira]
MPAKKKNIVGPETSSLRTLPNPAPQTDSLEDVSKLGAFRLLDLPIELRMIIYRMFDVHAADRLEDGEELAKIKKTRLSLFSVCKQVAEEWTPMFYQNKTFLVNVKLPDGHRIRDRLKLWKGHDASAYFGAKFLKSLAVNKAQHIRKLEYDLNWAYNSHTCYHPGDPIAIGWTQLDVEGARGLSRVLYDQQHKMPSLEQVVISAHYYRSINHEDFTGTATDGHLAQWWSFATSLSHARPDKDFEKVFEGLRLSFQSRSRYGLLKHWQVQKHIWFGMGSIPEAVMERLHRDKVLSSFRVRKVALVFEKAGTPTSPSGDDHTESNVSLHAWDPLGGY